MREINEREERDLEELNRRYEVIKTHIYQHQTALSVLANRESRISTLEEALKTKDQAFANMRVQAEIKDSLAKANIRKNKRNSVVVTVATAIVVKVVTDLLGIRVGVK